MQDQIQHDDESYTQDNVGTGAEISTENDVPANLNDGPSLSCLYYVFVRSLSSGWGP